MRCSSTPELVCGNHAFPKLGLSRDTLAQHPIMRVDREWMKSHPTSISAENEAAMQMCLRYINDSFCEGSELARKLTPDSRSVPSGQSATRETFRRAGTTTRFRNLAPSSSPTLWREWSRRGA